MLTTLWFKVENQVKVKIDTLCHISNGNVAFLSGLKGFLEMLGDH